MDQPAANRSASVSSAVSKKAQSKRSYHALHVLNTRPGTTYLAKVDRGEVEG